MSDPTDNTVATALLQARYVFRDLHAKDAGGIYGFDKLGLACEQAAVELQSLQQRNAELETNIERIRKLDTQAFENWRAERERLYAAEEKQRHRAVQSEQRIGVLEKALEPFAQIKPSSLYPGDGSEADTYRIYLANDKGPHDFTGIDLAAARAALKSSPAGGAKVMTNQIATREMCIRWIKNMLAGNLSGKDDDDLKVILSRPPPGPRITLTIDISDSSDASVQTHATGVAEPQIRPMLERAIRALRAEIDALEDCPYHQRLNPSPALK